MFNQVWRWAGQTRNSNKNIGVMAESIMTDLGILIGDTKFWIENKTYSFDEIAVRFHHRIVRIHLFPNGNGRHARLLTDLLLEELGKPKFTWGSLKNNHPIDVEGETRSKYISALKKADSGDYTNLIQFVRS
jgi:Fic-DOC domain mobile mystery protein B